MKRAALVVLLILGATAFLTACGGDSHEARDKAKDEAKENRNRFVPYVPHNGVEGKNYNEAQEIFDNPATIIWCTAFPSNPTVKPITVPIAGKLTSSSVSAFRSDEEVQGVALEAESVDGLYHGAPPAYRFGFTPSGQYVSFEGMQVICTTSVSEFQQESISIKPAAQINQATLEAEEALEAGDKAKANELLEKAAGAK